MSHKSEQLAASIQRAVQDRIARGLHDPRVSGLITITGVRVTADRQTATISVSVLPEDRQDLTLHGLESSAKFIRREVGDMIQTRQLPQFVFKLDTSLKRQAGVLKDLDRVRDERESQERASEKSGKENGKENGGDNGAGSSAT
jgi:ribosome-binding factor A